MRAGDEARTRDLQLGRLSLYQLSYSRIQYKSVVGVSGLEPLNPKERIYSPPQLPLCDTPKFPRFPEDFGALLYLEPPVGIEPTTY
jgi:hypothetical protein